MSRSRAGGSMRGAWLVGGLAAAMLIVGPRAAFGQLQLTPVATGLRSPLFVGPAGDGTKRLFIVEQGGVIDVPPGALKDLVPFQPTAARTFAESDVLRVFVPLFWSSKETLAGVTVSIRRADSVLAEQPGRATAVPGDANRRHASFTDVMPLHGLQPGNYVLAVAATLTGGRAATREVAFEIR